jgi:hypothetical protein
VSALVVLEHMGKLHAYEQVLVLALAFGPLLLLAVTIWIARRRAEHDDDGQSTKDLGAD